MPVKTKLHALCLILIILFAGIGYSKPGKQAYTWVRLNGTWEIKDSHLAEKRIWSNQWKLYALLDYNTVRTLTSFKNITEIQTTVQLSPPRNKTDNTELLLSFALQSPFKAWYFHLYGFRFIGNSKEIQSVSFIHSDRIDKTKKYATQNNYFIKILMEKKFNLQYNKKYLVSITYHKNKVSLYIDKRIVLTTTLPSKNMDGPIGLSSKNLSPCFDYIKVLNKKKIIFFDDFNKPETLWVPGVRATIKSTPKK